jgi:starch synthase
LTKNSDISISSARRESAIIPHAKALLAHPGTQYAPKLAAELADRDLLHQYWTGFSLAHDGFLARVASRFPAKARSLIAKRTISRVSSKQLKTCSRLAFQSAVWRKAFGNTEPSFFDRNRQFQECVPQNEIDRSDVVIGFDTSSWILAERCREIDKPFLLDQSIGHPISKERIYEGLRQRFPQWSQTIARKAPHHINAERREHELASRVVVPSRFVAETLMENDVERDKIIINPFGADTELFHPPLKRIQGREQIFLFVGTFTARKGLPVLLQAWNSLLPRDARLLLVGSGAIPKTVVDRLPDSVKVLGKQTRNEVAVLMQQADVLVFPSHFEGLALVQIEALASGLPVYGTKESGAADIVENGKTGLLLPAGDQDAWATALEESIKMPERVHAMQEHLSRDTSRYSWRAYGDRWAQILADVTSGI